jgi:outer membrane receptor for Fe3+-dicitrate
MMKHDFTITVELESGAEIEADLTLDISIDNDGIGAYEFWGARGFDAGSDYITVEGIKINSILHEWKGRKYVCRRFSDELRAAVAAAVESATNELAEEILARD